MALTHKQKRKWSLIILLVGLPIYIIVALLAIGLLPRPNILLELLIFSGLGIAWILPFKSVFKGVGQADPDAESDSNL